jgi:hypothetical protein
MRLKIHKVDGTIVHHHALLAKALKGKLVQGYAVCQNQFCWHCWVETPDGEIHDVTKGLTIPIEYQYTLPEGSEELEHEHISGNKQLFELYMNDPKRFWRESPKKVREFKIPK